MPSPQRRSRKVAASSASILQPIPRGPNSPNGIKIGSNRGNAERRPLSRSESGFGSPSVLHRLKYRRGAEEMFAGETAGDAVAASGERPFIEVENASLMYGGRKGD